MAVRLSFFSSLGRTVASKRTRCLAAIGLTPILRLFVSAPQCFICSQRKGPGIFTHVLLTAVGSEGLSSGAYSPLRNVFAAGWQGGSGRPWVVMSRLNFR